MPNWKKLIVSGSAAEITTLKATGLSADTSETKSLMINDDGTVKTRNLGSAAFSNTSAFTAAGVDNSTNVTLTGTPDYITISGQTITRNQIDLTADVTGVLPSANLDSDTAHLSGAQTFSGNKAFSGTFSTSNTMKFTGLSGVEDSKAVVINGDTGVVGTRDLGTGAFATVGTISGTSGIVPKFTGTNSIGNSEITDSGTVIQLGSNSSSQPTLYLDTDNRKVGFRTTSPESAFDVNGTMRVRNQLNVGHTTEQNLYVNGNGAAGGQYVKMGNYIASGSTWPQNGNYFGITERENQPKYFAAFGTGGKIVQGMRVVTIKLTGGSNAFKNLKTTGTTLIPAPGADYFIVPHHCTIHCTGGAKGNWSNGATAAIGFCSVDSPCTYFTQFNRVFRITTAMLNLNNTSWIYSQGANSTGMTTGVNKALILKAGTDLTTAPAGDWYIQIYYQLINKTAGLINNADRTMTSNS